ncbi:RDD family protein [Sphaerobacter thermophilus]|jgi:uncharacterized RDD family membrane protein YckC|uniref:RDD family protein n=1 Tax=Sphaerobacter thermophilus TaxID=2057 RepID=UPI000DB227A5|nr:MAG: hypothetical protein DIU58_07405 [Sphaerobacter thermophilus]
MTISVPTALPARIVLRRGLAYAIDVALAYGVFVGVQTALTPIRNRLDPVWMTSGPRLEGYIFLTISLPVWCYFTLCEGSRWQATVGKRLLGLRVVTATGERVGWGRALLRTVVKLLPWDIAHVTVALPRPLFIDPNTGALDWTRGDFRPGFLLAYAVLALTLVAVVRTPRRQALHDLAAGTVVVPEPRRGERAEIPS